MTSTRTSAVAALFLMACAAERATNNDNAATDETGGLGPSDGDGTGTSNDDGDDGNGSDAGTDDGSDEGGDGGSIQCEGKIMQCGDSIDNDADGHIDGSDPECTGPCDNDESSFQTGIPGDNVDCWQDCFFDGNSGEGDDKCRWNLRCDPENPGEGTMCAYTGGGSCDSMPADTPDACIDFCAGLTPNGCDCFGCCKVDTPSGEIQVFLGSGPDCSLDNLSACQSCTYNEDCDNPCDPNDCELCFGETDLPDHCDDGPTCPDGVQSCLEDSDCPEGLLCVTGCCINFEPPP